MNSNRYLNGILTVIALLLAFNLLLARDSSRSNGAAHLIRTAFAQSAQRQVSDEVVFFPVGNQDVRKWVFFDRRTNTIYKYDGGGGFDEAWQVGVLGQRLEKK